MSETQFSLGRKLERGEGDRDAVHIAVMPVIADELMGPGRPVRLVYGSPDHVITAPDEGGLGVIDPFLTTVVRPGDRVWLYLKPNTITSLRHTWTHDRIDLPRVPKDHHEHWLRQFADRWNFNYDDMIESATTVYDPADIDSWDRPFITAQGLDLHGKEDLGPDHDKFWYHLGQLTGRTFSPEHIEAFGWSCSC